MTTCRGHILSSYPNQSKQWNSNCLEVGTNHINLPISETLTFDDKVCEAVFCKFETVKKCIAIVYRPPEASVSSFSNVLSFLTESFKKVNDDSYQFCISGDFNFPFIDWKSL